MLQADLEIIIVCCNLSATVIFSQNYSVMPIGANGGVGLGGGGCLRGASAHLGAHHYVEGENVDTNWGVESRATRSHSDLRVEKYGLQFSATRSLYILSLMSVHLLHFRSVVVTWSKSPSLKLSTLASQFSLRLNVRYIRYTQVVLFGKGTVWRSLWVQFRQPYYISTAKESKGILNIQGEVRISLFSLLF